MPQFQLVKIGHVWGVHSFVDGLVVPSVNRAMVPPAVGTLGLDNEFRHNPEAVLNRLARLGRWEEAEVLWDRHIGP